MQKKHIVIISLLFVGLHASAQYFTDINVQVKKVIHCGGSWVDHDDDGDLDWVLTGASMDGKQHQKTARFYRNVNRKTVFSYFRTHLTNVSYSATSAGDFDNDGDIDIVLTGMKKNNVPFTGLYRNNRNNGFTLIKNTGIKHLARGDIAFKDFNRDGLLDIAICGKDKSDTFHTIVYKGNGKGKFSSMGRSMTGVIDGAVSWGDVDNDGDYDLFVTGQNASGQAHSALYEYHNNNFRKIPVAIPARKKSAAAWGDFDNDGNQDLVVTGENDQGNISLFLLKNIGGGRFINTTTNMEGTRSGSVDWGDYDHDGDIDILLTGEASGNRIISKIYRNDRHNSFTDIDAGLIGVYFSDGEWGDYDNDGDLDLFLAGLNKNYRPDARIYRNERIQTKEQENVSNDDYTPSSKKDIWHTDRLPSGRTETMYYFMITSCFCKPDSTYTEKGYHTFISESFRIELPYFHQTEFFRKIIARHERWGDIKGGHPSDGYVTMQAAREGRQEFIRRYTDEGYIIHHIPWGEQLQYGQR